MIDNDITTLDNPQPSAPPSGASTPRQPIDFVGLWDSVVIEGRQLAYVPHDRYRVWLTEAQINEIIARRQPDHDPACERPDVPYFHACPEDPSVLVRRLNGVEQRGRMSLTGQWERVDG